MRYFTSDPHFGHSFIAALRGYVFPEMADKYDLHTITDVQQNFHKVRRCHDFATEGPLVNIEQHDQDIIDNINNVVGVDDTLYILGDLSSGHKKAAMRACECHIASLNVPKENLHLILGNHDYCKNFDFAQFALGFFETVQERALIVMDINGVQQKVMLSHFPAYQDVEEQAKTTSDSFKTRHIHMSPHLPNDTLLLYGHTHSNQKDEFGNPNALHIGLDAWGLKPVAENEIIQYFAPLGR